MLAPAPIVHDPPGVLPVLAEGIPEEMTTYSSWVAWQAVERDGKTAKYPITPLTGRKASVSDSRTWTSFDEALASYEARDDLAGVGFVFSSGDPYFGLDFDGVLDPKTGGLNPKVARFVERARAVGCHVEWSPSGRGLHLVGKGRVEAFNRAGREAYDRGRFFTVTGATL